MAKLLDVQMRPDSMMASHILISYQGAATNDNKITRSKDKAKRMADSLLTILKKNIAQFPVMASTVSDDASNKAKGGDLGWFTDGTMVNASSDSSSFYIGGGGKFLLSPFIICLNNTF